VILAVLLAGVPASAAAQQYVWSVPSLDVMDKGKVLLEMYTYLGPTHPRSVYLGPRLVAGLGGHVELGFNVSDNVRPTSDSRVELAVKWKPWASVGERWQFQVGAHEYLPVYHRAYSLGSYVYGQVGRALPLGGRVSAGGYAYSEDVVAPSARGGAQLAYEQPLGPRLTLGADWVSGKHAAGYSTVGFYFQATPKLYLSAGYTLGNTGLRAGNHYLVVALSWEAN
jgi:hypothetical protein